MKPRIEAKLKLKSIWVELGGGKEGVNVVFQWWCNHV
jgi:hypothetical protein